MLGTYTFVWEGWTEGACPFSSRPQLCVSLLWGALPKLVSKEYSQLTSYLTQELYGNNLDSVVSYLRGKPTNYVINKEATRKEKDKQV